MRRGLTTIQRDALRSIDNDGDGWYRGQAPKKTFEGLARRGLCEISLYGRWRVRITDAGRSELAKGEASL